MEVAIEELAQRRGLGLGTRHEPALVHLAFDGARPLLGPGACREALALLRMALPSDLCFPLSGTALANGRHSHTPFPECGNAVANGQFETQSTGVDVLTN